MYTVGELMTRKLVTLDQDELLGDVDGLLARRHIRHLPVVRGGKLVGLITHRDLLRCFAGGNGGKCQAKDVMTAPVRSVTADTPAREAIRIMRDHKFGCLPVVKGDDELVGILTEADLVRFAEKVIEDMDRAQLAKEYRA